MPHRLAMGHDCVHSLKPHLHFTRGTVVTDVPPGDTQDRNDQKSHTKGDHVTVSGDNIEEDELQE